jgi:hypothetical protein
MDCQESRLKAFTLYKTLAQEPGFESRQDERFLGKNVQGNAVVFN